MGVETGIEWCDSTVNPIIGCDGCELWSPGKPADEQHCYAAELAKRYGGRNGWPKSFSEPEFFPGRTEKALKWPDLTGTSRPGKPWLDGLPRLVFLNDLSDTFIKEPSPWEWLPDYIPAMAESPHIWIFLTKRARMMYRFFRDYGSVPPNFWLGVTVTGPRTVNRLLDLMKIKGMYLDVMIWLSAEPLLGPIDLEMIADNDSFPGQLNALTGEWWPAVGNADEEANGVIELSKLDWVVAGGESGSNARPCHPDWLRQLRDGCREAGVPFFFKQHGMFIHTSQAIPGVHYSESEPPPTGDHFLKCTSKHAAGRLLDGREHSEMPWREEFPE